MMDKFLNIFRIPDLRKKLIFTALLILVYRLGGKVPVPGIDRAALAMVMQNFTIRYLVYMICLLGVSFLKPLFLH